MPESSGHRQTKRAVPLRRGSVATSRGEIELTLVEWMERPRMEESEFSARLASGTFDARWELITRFPRLLCAAISSSSQRRVQEL